MADLVEAVKLVCCQIRSRVTGFVGNYDECVNELARAAIAAVLDDMAEPSEAVLATVAEGVDARPLAIEFWQAMLAQYRKEMLG